MTLPDFHWQELIIGVLGVVAGWLAKLFHNKE